MSSILIGACVVIGAFIVTYYVARMLIELFIAILASGSIVALVLFVMAVFHVARMLP